MNDDRRRRLDPAFVERTAGRRGRRRSCVASGANKVDATIVGTAALPMLFFLLLLHAPTLAAVSAGSSASPAATSTEPTRQPSVRRRRRDQTVTNDDAGSSSTARIQVKVEPFSLRLSPTPTELTSDETDTVRAVVEVVSERHLEHALSSHQMDEFDFGFTTLKYVRTFPLAGVTWYAGGGSGGSSGQRTRELNADDGADPYTILDFKGGNAQYELSNVIDDGSGNANSEFVPSQSRLQDLIADALFPPDETTEGSLVSNGLLAELRAEGGAFAALTNVEYYNEPSTAPSAMPTMVPTTGSPTDSPSAMPSSEPSSKVPSEAPSVVAISEGPSHGPTVSVTASPSIAPSASSSSAPSASPTGTPASTSTSPPPSATSSSPNDESVTASPSITLSALPSASSLDASGSVAPSASPTGTPNAFTPNQSNDRNAADASNGSTDDPNGTGGNAAPAVAASAGALLVFFASLAMGLFVRRRRGIQRERRRGVNGGKRKHLHVHDALSGIGGDDDDESSVGMGDTLAKAAASSAVTVEVYSTGGATMPLTEATVSSPTASMPSCEWDGERDFGSGDAEYDREGFQFEGEPQPLHLVPGRQPRPYQTYEINNGGFGAAAEDTLHHRGTSLESLPGRAVVQQDGAASVASAPSTSSGFVNLEFEPDAAWDPDDDRCSDAETDSRDGGMLLVVPSSSSSSFEGGAFSASCDGGDEDSDDCASLMRESRRRYERYERDGGRISGQEPVVPYRLDFVVDKDGSRGEAPHTPPIREIV